MLIDSCMSGFYTLSDSNKIDSITFLDNFLEHGCAVLASCNASQESRFVPGKPVSLFTALLCIALTSPYTIRDGTKTFEEIAERVVMMAKNWNERNPSRTQTPIYRSNVGGTVVFNVGEYHPYKAQAFFFETVDYIVTSVEPVHAGTAKRYSCNVILKKPSSTEDVIRVCKETLNRVQNAEIYENEISEKRWRGKKVNVVFLFFGYDESDVQNSNFAYRAIWADGMQAGNKGYWYNQSRNSKIIDDIWIEQTPHYDFMHKFNAENTGDETDLRQETDRIISRMISLAESVIAEFHEYQNEIYNEKEFIHKIRPFLEDINSLYIDETNLDLPPSHLRKWCQSCSSLAATIHDFFVYYDSRFLYRRTEQNRTQCMIVSIKRYHKELRKLRDEEHRLFEE